MPPEAREPPETPAAPTRPAAASAANSWQPAASSQPVAAMAASGGGSLNYIGPPYLCHAAPFLQETLPGVVHSQDHSAG